MIRKEVDHPTQIEMTQKVKEDSDQDRGCPKKEEKGAETLDSVALIRNYQLS